MKMARTLPAGTIILAQHGNSENRRLFAIDGHCYDSLGNFKYYAVRFYQPKDARKNWSGPFGSPKVKYSDRIVANWDHEPSKTELNQARKAS